MILTEPEVDAAIEACAVWTKWASPAGGVVQYAGLAKSVSLVVTKGLTVEGLASRAGSVGGRSYQMWPNQALRAYNIAERRES